MMTDEGVDPIFQSIYDGEEEALKEEEGTRHDNRPYYMIAAAALSPLGEPASRTI